MDLNMLKLGLMLIILIWSIYSGITYMARRSDNKGALRDLRQDGQPARRMTDEEQALVQPFLFDPAKPKKQAQLINDGVYPLHGAFVRHGIEASQGGSTMHDTLGDVDVVLPYDARSYLVENNHAEVVLTEKFAIVVALNGEFDLAGGREREQRRQKQDQQWNSGRTGALQSVIDLEVDPPEADEAPPTAEQLAQAERELDDATRVEILAQRDETPAEVAARQGRGFGFWVSVLWALAFLCLGLAGGAGHAVRRRRGRAGRAGLVADLAPARAGRAAEGEPRARRVERHRAEQSVNSQTVSTQLFLGDKLPVNLPDHWRANLQLPDDGRVDMDLRVQDYAVLRLGGNYSVDEEQRLFPRVFWGRHMTLALTGLAALGALWAVAPNLPGDLALTRAWVQSDGPRSYASAEALAQDPPGFGQPVSLRGAARCELVQGTSEQAARADCDRLRWGGAAPTVPELEIDPAIMALHTGEFLRTRANPMLDMLLQSQVAQRMRTNPMAAYNMRGLSFYRVSGLTDTVLAVERGCAVAGRDAADACGALKAALVEHLLFADDEPKNWAELLKLAQDGAFKRKGLNDESAIISRNAETVRARARSSAFPAIMQAMNRAAAAAQASQTGGVALRVWPGPHAMLPSIIAKNEEDLLSSWSRQSRIVAQGEPLPFRVDGLVSGVRRDASGLLELSVDSERSLDEPWSSLAYTAWLLLAALLVLVHLPLAVIRLRQAGARRRALDEYSARRSASRRSSEMERGRPATSVGPPAALR